MFHLFDVILDVFLSFMDRDVVICNCFVVVTSNLPSNLCH